MRVLFGPAVRLMGRLRYAHKFTLLGLLTLAAVGFLLVTLLAGLQRDIAASHRELQGLQLVLQFNRIIQLTQQHRGLSSGLLSGNATLRELVARKGEAVDAAGAGLAPLLPRGSLASTHWRELTGDWREIRQHGLEWPVRDNTVRHDRLIEKMLAVSTDAADATSLSLLSDLSGHYLYDTLIKLPQFAEQLGQTRAYGMAILAKPAVGDKDRLELAGLLGHVQTARALHRANLDKVLLYNPGLQQALGEADRRFELELKQAETMVREDIIGGRAAIAPLRYFERMTALIDLCYASGENILAPALQTLIEQRRAAARATLLLNGAVSAAGLLLFAYLAMGAYLALTGQIEQVLATLRAMVADSAQRAGQVDAIAAGDLAREVPPPAVPPPPTGPASKDEIGALADALYQMAQAQHSLGVGFKRMAHTLRVHQAEERLQDWHKSGINALNAQLRGDRRIEGVAQSIIGYLTEQVGAAAGALYRHAPEQDALCLMAAHVLSAAPPRIALGEGLAGTAARALRRMVLSPVPAGFLQIASASGQAGPASVVALPLLHDGRLLGLVEVSGFQPFSAAQLDWLDQAAEALAIAIDVDQARARVNELLAETQSQTEELRVQQDSLQQSNEELEERAQLLEQQRELIRLKSQESEAAARALELKAEQLEQVSAYKSEFLANMSHELRTPLNSMLILSSLLQQNKGGRLDAKQVDFAATIYGAGQDLLNLINDILDLSKIEAGRLELQLEDMGLDDLVEQARGLFQPVADQKGVALALELLPGLPASMHSDPQRVHQIVKNLLANAFKFTAAGEVRLSIGPAPAGSPGLHGPGVAFAVRDTGIGIPPEQHERIFHAFQQGDTGTSRKYGGSGLGLSISRLLARKLGGDISLDSVAGAGSVFTLYLPLAAPAAEPMGPAAIVLTPPRASAPSAPVPAPSAAQEVPPMTLEDDRAMAAPGQRTVLIIEDDAAFAGVLRDAARAHGFLALVAGNGEDGLALAAHYLPQALLLDVKLPHIDGWGVMRALKDDMRTRHIPVHFVSCGDDAHKALAMGAVGYASKPLDGGQLEHVLGELDAVVAPRVKKLLVVEDNEAEARSVAALLDAAGLEITLAHSGSEALRLLAGSAYDCMVLDLGLADMSGYDLLDQLPRRAEGRPMPVVIHSGQAMSAPDEMRLRRHADSVIIKGARSPERLLAEVSLFLHLVDSVLPEEKRDMIRQALDKEAMFESRTVLLVDDDIRNVFSLSSVLLDKGMRVVDASDGVEALERLEEHGEIGIVLMDIMMPRMDGYETMRRMRADPRWRSLPIIALSAKAMPGDQKLCLEAGASDYIAKPVDLDKLFSLMRVWLYQEGR